MQPETRIDDALQRECDARIAAIFVRCTENQPNFGVPEESLTASLRRSLEKFSSASPEPVSSAELNGFFDQIQADDLFLALACAGGNERAWWEFDQQHRGYMERVARHLAKTDVDAQEVIDAVYVELYGTRVVDGERVAKFATYSGRGSIRGWLRTVIWHSLVDLHRAGHDEVSLDEMTESVGEGAAHASFAKPPTDGESRMIDEITQDRYRAATVNAIRSAFEKLDAHERLLLLYYHVENLKLREIAKLCENEDSPLRGWFQRKTQTRESGGRTHESTVMRWLEKTYARVLELFKAELKERHSFSADAISECMELAAGDLTSGNIFAGLRPG
jgi:RNA polymerase sigma-70 factor (ECF subfamily)